jgi:hypothetical protein
VSVVDFAKARLLREVERRPAAGQLLVDWVIDDDGLPIVKIVFTSDPAQVQDPHAFLAGYLPSLAAHLRGLAADTSVLVEEEGEPSAPPSPLTSGAYGMTSVGPVLPDVPLRSYATSFRVSATGAPALTLVRS